MNTRMVAHARVRAVLFIATGDVWGGDCGLAQVDQQARDSAHALLSQPERLRRAIAAKRVTLGEMAIESITIVPEAREATGSMREPDPASEDLLLRLGRRIHDLLTSRSWSSGDGKVLWAHFDDFRGEVEPGPGERVE